MAISDTSDDTYVCYMYVCYGNGSDMLSKSGTVLAWASLVTISWKDLKSQCLLPRLIGLGPGSLVYPPKITNTE